MLPSHHLALFTWNHGGPYERIASGLEQACRSFGVEFTLITLGGARKPHTAIATHIQLRRRSARTCAFNLASVLRRTRPELLLVSPTFLSPAAILAGRLANVAVAPWEGAFVDRELPSLPRRMQLFPALARASYRRAALVLGQSPDVVESLARTYRGIVPSSRIRLLPPPIDLAEIRYEVGKGQRLTELLPGLAERRGHATRQVIFASLGRLTFEKGHDVLLRALGRLSDGGYEQWHAVLIGDGPARDELEGLARDMGIAGHVSFLGHMDHPLGTLHDVDVLVHPSRWEGFGVAIIEALAIGVPVIASDCPGGPTYILAHGGGRTFPNGDDSALAQELASLLKNPATLAELRARTTTASRVSDPNRIGAAVVKLLAELDAT